MLQKLQNTCRALWWLSLNVTKSCRGVGKGCRGVSIVSTFRPLLDWILDSISSELWKVRTVGFLLVVKCNCSYGDEVDCGLHWLARHPRCDHSLLNKITWAVHKRAVILLLAHLRFCRSILWCRPFTLSGADCCCLAPLTSADSERRTWNKCSN